MLRQTAVVNVPPELVDLWPARSATGRVPAEVVAMQVPASSALTDRFAASTMRGWKCRTITRGLLGRLEASQDRNNGPLWRNLWRNLCAFCAHVFGWFGGPRSVVAVYCAAIGKPRPVVAVCLVLTDATERVPPSEGSASLHNTIWLRPSAALSIFAILG